MNYDDMPAGPQIDTLVAERVMGWDKNDPPARYRYLDRGQGFRWYDEGETPFHDRVQWEPSTYIEHAWEVVLNLRKVHSRWLTLECLALWPDDFEWKAVFDSTAMATAEDAQLAICRAALKAVGA